MHASESLAAAGETSAARPKPSFRWRVVDIVVGAVVGVAMGIVFWAWGALWGPISAPFEALLPGLQAAPAALWVLAGVLGGLIIRKPGAALYVELVAATVSALIGTQWGPLTIESGLVQGLGAELVFLIFLYRVWNLPVAVLAGAAAGLAMAINDLVLYYAGSSADFAFVYAASAVVGGALIAGALAWFAMRGLASTGALARFAAGRSARLVD
ncbi:ECF transporter S component [Agromyces seonyuensis]|uniref:Uncharacterized protein n=1 Tax=Agromyces seonyuensis TaxID=2662446 RepID=A0A6I4NSG3_9MICO|nr:hypothetical protein [Agromyces seonyuensis]